MFWLYKKKKIPQTLRYGYKLGLLGPLLWKWILSYDIRVLVDFYSKQKKKERKVYIKQTWTLLNVRINHWNAKGRIIFLFCCPFACIFVFFSFLWYTICSNALSFRNWRMKGDDEHIIPLICKILPSTIIYYTLQPSQVENVDKWSDLEVEKVA